MIWRYGSIDNPPPPITSTEGQSFYLLADGIASGPLSFLARDPDNADLWREAPFQQLAFSGSNLPDGMIGPETMQNVTRTNEANPPPRVTPIAQAQFYGRLSLTSAGLYDVVITVSDPNGESAEYQFDWTVHNYKLTIAEMTLGSTLGGNDRHAVIPDPILDSSNTIKQPSSVDLQWQDLDLDHVSDLSFDFERNPGEGVLSPVLLTKGTAANPMRITASASFNVATPVWVAWEGTETIYLRSNADAVPIVVSSLGGWGVTFDGVVSGEKNAIEYDPDFRLNWEFSLDGQTWEPAG